MSLQTTLGGTPATASSYVREVTAQNFMQEVMQPSMQMPILLYFTASWCGPCKAYGPILEKVVNDAKGKLRLARVDVDKSPEIAQQFRIQSVPVVYVFMQGQPLDAFQGALPESQVRQLVQQLLAAVPQSVELVHSLEEGRKLLAEGKAQEALQHFMALLEEDGTNMDALAGVVSAEIALGDLDKAEAMLATVPEASANHEGVLSAKAALKLARSAPGKEALNALQAKLAKNEGDHQARMELAVALFAAGQQEEAIAELLRIIGKNKDWNEGAARTQLLQFFEALGHTHPLTMQGRRKLSTILFA